MVQNYNAAGFSKTVRRYCIIRSCSAINFTADYSYRCPINAIYTDAMNQAVQVFGNVAADATTTNFDTRTFFELLESSGKSIKEFGYQIQERRVLG
jgi:hypothetical protein